MAHLVYISECDIVKEQSTLYTLEYQLCPLSFNYFQDVRESTKYLSVDHILR